MRSIPLIYFLVLPLSACGAETHHRFLVEGVEDAFCVPRIGYVPPEIWYIPNDPPGSELGFAIGGCHWLRPNDQSSCTLPPELISTSIMPLSEKRSRSWRELKGAVVFDAAAHTSGVEFSIDPVTGFFVMFNPNAFGKQWYIWERSSDSTNHLEGMVDSDRLIASCANVGDFPGTGGLGRAGGHVCKRYIQGPEYALEYRFISKVRVPSHEAFEQIETGLFDQIDRWRCPR